MKSSSERPTVICPKSGAEHKLRRNGKTICGTQVYLCTVCRKVYTLEPKRCAYPEEVCRIAIKEYFAGASGCAAGKLHGLSKGNVYNWIKKTEALFISSKTDFTAFKLDGIFWFIKERNSAENGVNAYVMMMISRIPRQIIGFDVYKSIAQKIIKRMVNSVPPSKTYYTDG